MCAYLRHTLTLDDGEVLRKMEAIPSSKGMTQTALALQRERAVFHLLRLLSLMSDQSPLRDSRWWASQRAKSLTSANFPRRASIENT